MHVKLHGGWMERVKVIHEAEAGLVIFPIIVLLKKFQLKVNTEIWKFIKIILPRNQVVMQEVVFTVF